MHLLEPMMPKQIMLLPKFKLGTDSNVVLSCENKFKGQMKMTKKISVG